MIMTLGTLDRQTQQTLAICFCFIEDIFNTIFFRNNSTFFSVLVIAEKSCCQHLFFGRFRKKVTGNLPCQEFIVRKVLIECMNDPIAPWPLSTNIIILVAIAI